MNAFVLSVQEIHGHVAKYVTISDKISNNCKCTSDIKKLCILRSEYLPSHLRENVGCHMCSFDQTRLMHFLSSWVSITDLVVGITETLE